MKMQRHRVRLAAIGMLAAVTCLAIPGHASAQLTACRSDPIVFLSNNHKVQLTSTITIAPSGLTSVNYVLHAPAGTSVTGVTWTGGGIHETLGFYADEPQNSYDMSETVQVRKNPIPFTLSATVLNTAGGGSTSATANASSPHAASAHVNQS